MMPAAARALRWIAMLGAAALLACAPLLDLPTFGLLPDRLAAPGSLQLLALCLVFGALAMSYDVLFGFTGLLSFGHALFFASGAYTFAIAVGVLHLSGAAALGLTLAVALVLPLVVGAISLRTSGIAFAMVTLAFAQAGAVLVGQDPWHATGGELGLALDYDRLPAVLVGVANTRWLYWLALALLVVVAAAVWWSTGSVTGRVWQAIRENGRRVEMLGLRPYAFKLAAFVTGSFLATLCGIVYVLLVGGANPSVTTAEFTLAILVMVVLGGAGSGWGALLGGIVYTYLDLRLVAIAGSPALESLPAPLRIPLSQPLFILGLIFILVVLFQPDGITGWFRRGPREDGAPRRLRRWLRRPAGRTRGA